MFEYFQDHLGMLKKMPLDRKLVKYDPKYQTFSKNIDIILEFYIKWIHDPVMYLLVAWIRNYWFTLWFEKMTILVIFRPGSCPPHSTQLVSYNIFRVPQIYIFRWNTKKIYFLYEIWSPNLPKHSMFSDNDTTGYLSWGNCPKYILLY